jgi:hypothetical protein
MKDYTDRLAEVFLGILALTIIGLKITGIITIPWLYLCMPFIICFGIGCALAILVFVTIVVKGIIVFNKEKNDESGN